VTQPPPELIEFWKRFMRPGDGHVIVTTGVLADNGSPEAAALLEGLLRDPRRSLEDRVRWVQTAIVRDRHQAEILRLVRRLLAAKLPPVLSEAIAASAFEQPAEWGTTCPGPGTPPIKSYSKEARRELRLVAAAVRATHPERDLEREIQAASDQLDHLDQVDATTRQ
jgi:hypothetical protein